MTGDADGPAVSDAQVQAAAERWARAAGVPLSTVRGTAPQSGSVTLRVLRGVLLGAAAGVFLMVLARADGASAALWGPLALGAGLLACRMAAQRRNRVPGRAAPSRG
ncbi:hypothetical protein [Blastococcus sp. SYSU DS1024]